VAKTKGPFKKLRVLAFMDEDLVPPDDVEGLTDEEIKPWLMEYDVVSTLVSMGHEVYKLGLHDELTSLRTAVEEIKPDIAFNILEEFQGKARYDYLVVSYLESMGQAYTGCNPRGLIIARDKSLTKKILTYHRIRVPDFAVFPMNKRIKRPRGLDFPLMVKSLVEEASLGISQASVVENDTKLVARVEFIHNSIGTDALVEKYIEGRELYVGMLGNGRLLTLPVWELSFGNLPAGVPQIATARVKWDYAYQKKIGLNSRAAKNLPEGLEKKVAKISRRIYQTLGLSGYARLDYRLDAAGELYLLEANPNPQLAYGEDFAESAHVAGIPYEELLQKILNLGMAYRAS
jgi:D-alanine-D-alanine ligase